jgi:hypothetical protein
VVDTFLHARSNSWVWLGHGQHFFFCAYPGTLDFSTWPRDLRLDCTSVLWYIAIAMAAVLVSNQSLINAIFFTAVIIAI